MILGHNINSSCGFINTINIAIETGAKICQVFLGSPQSFKVKRKPVKELIYVRDQARDNDIQIVVHANFMLNYCNPVDSFIHKSAIKVLVADLEDSIILGAIGVVIHMGKNVVKLNISEEEALSNYVLGVKSVLEHSSKESTIILETGAGQGTEICTSIVDLGMLRSMFTYKEQERLKFCIDTCHIFSAGYDLSNPRYVRFLDAHIEENLGWDNVVVIHLNDSKQPLDCHKDRHADIGKGCIELDGLMEFIRLCFDKNIPLVLETPVEEHNGVIFTFEEQMEMINCLL